METNVSNSKRQEDMEEHMHNECKARSTSTALRLTVGMAELTGTC